MDLTSWLLRRTLRRPLVLTAPGGTGTRVAVERFLREQGWPEALSPAEANMLVIAGGPFEPYATQVWRAMPAPRVRVDITEGSDPGEELHAAARLLHDTAEQRRQAQPTDEVPHAPAEHSGHAAMSHDHGHHMGDMEMPGGIPMADRAPDRDGLMLDQLNVPLGPALPLWPVGLTVHTRLQGDVIQDATVEILSSAHTGEPRLRTSAAPQPPPG